MGTLYQEQFPEGWTPNSNEMNGSPAGLLRADNLVFEEQGVVGLARGCRRISSGATTALVNALYSKTLDGGNKLRYLSEGGRVARNAPTADPTDFSVGVLSGGSASNSAFASAWGHTVICSGTKKVIDDGTNIYDIDLGASSLITVTPNAPPSTTSPALDAEWVAGGTGEVITASAGNYIKVQVNTTTFRGIAHNYKLGTGTPFTWDTTNFGATGQDTANDLFSMDIRFEPTKLEKIRVEMILEARDSVDIDTSNPSDYFFHEWYADTILETNPDYFDPNIFAYQDTQEFINRIRENLEPGIGFVNYYKEGENFWGTLQCLRSQFKRVGFDDSKSWKDVKCIRVTFKMTEAVDCYFWQMKFVGGTAGQLTGYYQYLQVNCYNTGNFIQRGIVGTPSPELQLIKANASVTPVVPGGHVNRIEIYRSSTQTPGYYLVKTIVGSPPSVASFVDSVSDIDALRDNIPLEYYRAALPDDIEYIVGPTYQRLIYFDLKSMYVGYRNDPGSYDSRHQAVICSASGETILWVRTVIDGVIMVGTSHDIYQIRGDFAYDESIGLLNFSVEALGIEQVPVSSAVAIYGTQVIYLAEDGWRSIAGSTTYSMVIGIDRLYHGFTCHEISPVSLGSNNYRVSSVCVSKNRLICSVDETAGGRALHIFDLERHTWTYWRGTINVIPGYLLSEEDGVVIFNSFGDSYVYEWDYGYAFGDGNNLDFRMRTTYNHNKQPTNRKDPLTLQVKADSGGADVTITIRGKYNDDTVSSLSFTASFLGTQTKFFSLAAGLGTPKYFQLEISSTTYTTIWKFYAYSIDYVEHPLELNYLLIQPDNLGVPGRKRIPSCAFLMDTMGNSVTCTPFIDGISQASSSLFSIGKSVLFHHFTGDTLGYTRGFTFTATTGVFEFYEVLPHREVEVLPDPVKYKLLNAYNFGTTKRKRLIQFAFMIDTKGSSVIFTPYIDGTPGASYNYITTYKKTVIYFFNTDTIGIDVAGTLSGSNEFEFYGISADQMVSEALPAACTFRYLNTFNFGTTKRKRLVQFAFIIDTKGSPVTFTPIIDGIPGVPQSYTTNYKKTVIYFFSTDTIGVDVGGTLAGVSNFEFYDLATDQMVSEALPPAVQFMHIQSTNLGSPNKKRLRTLPFEIDTHGNPVVFTPMLDGVVQQPSTHITNRKETVFHYFSTDVFPVDIEGTLSGISDFEFYGMSQSVVVERLPIGRIFDQVGPMDFNRQARIYGFRVQLIAEAPTLTYNIFSDDTSLVINAFPTVVGKDKTYEVNFAKGVNISTIRIELSAALPFYRLKFQLKVDITGSGTENRWINL